MPFEREQYPLTRRRNSLLAAARSRGGNTKLTRAVRVHHSNNQTMSRRISDGRLEMAWQLG